MDSGLLPGKGFFHAVEAGNYLKILLSDGITSLGSIASRYVRFGYGVVGNKQTAVKALRREVEKLFDDRQALSGSAAF
jgi:hypothetical protein